MKTTTACTLGVVLLLSLCLTALGQDAVRAHVTVLGTNLVSVGRIPCHQFRSIPFRLMNISDTPIKIRNLRPTCFCVKGEHDKTSVQPGEEFVVTVRLDPFEISGAFEKSLWVTTNAGRNQQQIKLTVIGESIPSFTGQPSARIAWQTPALGVTWTNVYALAATEKGLRLGSPVYETNAELDVAFTLQTDRSGTNDYQAMLVVKPLALGRHEAMIELPVEGQTDMPPVRFNMLVRAGLKLSAVPTQLLLPFSKTPVVRRMLFHTDEETAKPEALTWEPQIAGLDVQSRKSADTSNLAVELRFSPEAVHSLLKMKEPALTFLYTNYESVVVHVLRTEEEPEDGMRRNAVHLPARARFFQLPKQNKANVNR